MKHQKMNIFVVLLFCGILTSVCSACNQPADDREDSFFVPFDESHSIQSFDDKTETLPQGRTDANYSSYESKSLGVILEYPREWTELVVLSDGMTWDAFIMNQLAPIECILISIRSDMFNSCLSTADDDYETVLAYVYWRQPNTSGPEADMGDAIVLAEREDGSECVCFMPLTTKMGYTGDGMSTEEKEIWDACVTVETGILNGKCRIITEPKK